MDYSMNPTHIPRNVSEMQQGKLAPRVVGKFPFLHTLIHNEL
jgi:hypothetical protein